MISIAWQLDGKKGWWVYPQDATPDLGPPRAVSECCDTWNESPRYPHPLQQPPASLSRCWGAELEPGDFLVFKSNTPHYAYPLSPMVSAITHLYSCNSQRGDRVRAIWPESTPPADPEAPADDEPP